jgi:phosphoribosylamine---glycine ligase
VNEDGIWPLEFTCRFGYPGFAILDPLQETSWGEIFRRMVTRSGERFQARSGFSVGVVLTTPPFPYTRHEVSEPVGLPVLIDRAAEPGHLHFGEVGLDEHGQLVTSGLYGWTMVVTGRGATIAEAKRQAYDHVDQVFIPNVRYRLDIGDRLMAGDFERLERLGMLVSGNGRP